MTFNGKLMILKTDKGVVASLTLPPGMVIAEDDMAVYDISGRGIPLGTNDHMEFASVADAVKHFKDAGFTLTASRL